MGAVLADAGIALVALVEAGVGAVAAEAGAALEAALCAAVFAEAPVC